MFSLLYSSIVLHFAAFDMFMEAHVSIFYFFSPAVSSPLFFLITGFVNILLPVVLSLRQI